jgi:hypothetical protein
LLDAAALLREEEPMLQANMNKERSTDRIFVLKPMEGMTAKATSGLLDNRLFKGENQLHAKMNPTNCIWGLNYDGGIVPGPLQQRFTSFSMLYKFVEEYFKRRNIQIVEVKD